MPMLGRAELRLLPPPAEPAQVGSGDFGSATKAPAPASPACASLHAGRGHPDSDPHYRPHPRFARGRGWGSHPTFQSRGDPFAGIMDPHPHNTGIPDEFMKVGCQWPMRAPGPALSLSRVQEQCHCEPTSKPRHDRTGLGTWGRRTRSVTGAAAQHTLSQGSIEGHTLAHAVRH